MVPLNKNPCRLPNDALDALPPALPPFFFQSGPSSEFLHYTAHFTTFLNPSTLISMCSSLRLLSGMLSRLQTYLYIYFHLLNSSTCSEVKGEKMNKVPGMKISLNIYIRSKFPKYRRPRFSSVSASARARIPINNLIKSGFPKFALCARRAPPEQYIVKRRHGEKRR